MTYNLFISHSWAYNDEYEKLVRMLNDKPYFYYKNYSVPKNDPIHNASYTWQLKRSYKKTNATSKLCNYPCRCVFYV